MKNGSGRAGHCVAELPSARSVRLPGLAGLVRMSGVGPAGRAVRFFAFSAEGARIGGVSERQIRLKNENRPVFIQDCAGARCGSSACVPPYRHHAAGRSRCNGRRSAGRPEQAQAVCHKRHRRSGDLRSHRSTPRQDLREMELDAERPGRELVRVALRGAYGGMCGTGHVKPRLI